MSTITKFTDRPGCGHWTQQERPAEVNAALLDFLARIEGSVPR